MKLTQTNIVPHTKKLSADWLSSFQKWTPEMLQEVDNDTLQSFAFIGDKIGNGKIWDEEMNKRFGK